MENKINDIPNYYKSPLSEFKRKNYTINGVYCIRNINSMEFYIGSSSSKSYLADRIYHHKNDLINNNHCNKHLQRSFNKNGIENFEIFVIEECLPELCIIREQFWIDNLKPQYNQNPIAGSSLGRKVSEETGRKISEANKKFWAKEENRERMMESCKKRSNSIPEENRIVRKKHRRVIDLNTGIIYKYTNDLCKAINYSNCYLCMILSGKRKSSKINIKYVDELGETNT